eukprot:gene5504-biopygen22241
MARLYCLSWRGKLFQPRAPPGGVIPERGTDGPGNKELIRLTAGHRVRGTASSGERFFIAGVRPTPDEAKAEPRGSQIIVAALYAQQQVDGEAVRHVLHERAGLVARLVHADQAGEEPEVLLDRLLRAQGRALVAERRDDGREAPALAGAAVLAPPVEAVARPRGDLAHVGGVHAVLPGVQGFWEERDWP